MSELYWISLMTLLYWEWHLIPRWPLRSIFAQFAEQLLKYLVSWGSPGKPRVFHDRSLLGRCFQFFVLPVLEYCSAVWWLATNTHLKLLDRAVSGAWFLTGGVFECDIAHRRSVAGLWMLYKIRCNLVYPLNGAVPGPYVPVLQYGLHTVLWLHIGTIMHRCAEELHSTVGLSFASRCPSGSILLWYCGAGQVWKKYKSTHISMISNSVTHLRSYTNTTIATNSVPISPETSHDRGYRQAKRRRLRIERRYRSIEWWVFDCFMMFHNVLSVS